MPKSVSTYFWTGKRETVGWKKSIQGRVRKEEDGEKVRRGKNWKLLQQ